MALARHVSSVSCSLVWWRWSCFARAFAFACPNGLICPGSTRFVGTIISRTRPFGRETASELFFLRCICVLHGSMACRLRDDLSDAYDLNFFIARELFCYHHDRRTVRSPTRKSWDSNFSLRSWTRYAQNGVVFIPDVCMLSQRRAYTRLA